VNKLQEIMGQINALNDQVKAAFDSADEDGGRALSAEEKQTVIDSNKKIEALEHQAKDLHEQQEMRGQTEARSRQLRQPAGGLGAGGYSGEEKARKDLPRLVNPGAMVLEDAEFKAWLDRHMNGGAFTSGQFHSSPRVSIPGGMKTLVTGSSDTTGGALIPAYQMYPQMVQGTYARPLTIRDLVTTGNTTADAIEFPIEGTPTNAAAPVAEATATSGSSGAKPESALALSKGTTTVKTIAHWVPATRRALADAGMLRMYIDTFLRYGLDEELEDQMLTGSGSGENFTGVLNTSGIQTQAYATDLLTTTRKARTLVRVTGRATPTAYVMHPNDWEDIDLLQDNEARYYFGGPSVLGMPRLWGLPVVESEGMTEGTSVCADWRRAVLLDREQTQILVSDSHSDFFVRNLIAILAELRAAFFVIRPSAFVSIDLTA
jgi:HK97 family phage major capsid protein